MGRALIIGAGIGGLAAAVALRRAGWEAAVFERAAELREVGAGITLWPNALRAMRHLGQGEALAERAMPSDRDGAVRTPSGKTLIALAAESMKEIVGEFAVVVHRAELIEILRDAARSAGAAIELGRPCAGFAQDVGGVSATFADGSSERGDVLVGADGLRSVVRQQLHPDARPRYQGYTAWRGIVPFDASRVTPGETWGRGCRFGLVPMSADRLYWFATNNAPEGQPSGPDGHQRDLLRLFGTWHEPIPEVIRRTPPGAILRNDLYDLDPLTAWGAGRVTLLGDAAHAMTPNLGQGGCQALEDAVELGVALRGATDVAAALRSYKARRIPRVSKVVLDARSLGRIGQWANPVACGVRSLLMRMTPQRGQLRRMAKTMEWEPAGA